MPTCVCVCGMREIAVFVSCIFPTVSVGKTMSMGIEAVFRLVLYHNSWTSPLSFIFLRFVLYFTSFSLHSYNLHSRS